MLAIWRGARRREAAVSVVLCKRRLVGGKGRVGMDGG